MSTKRTYLFGTTVLAGLIAAAAPALAQQSTAAQSTRQSTAAQQQATQVDEIVVTGTRIRSSEYNTANPVQIITSEQTDLRGVPDAATAILNSTLAVGSFQWNDQLTGYVTNGGGGTQSAALRGLGSTRTLTLLNGRRAGPAGTRGQVQAFDLGVIPSALIERTELLKDGASSIYGSDAVAGVINFITRSDFEGGAMNVYASVPVEGGGEVFKIDGAYGMKFDRGYVSFGGEYQKTEIQRRSDRDYTSCTVDYVLDPTTGARRDYIDPLTGNYKCYNQNSNYVSLLTSGQNIVRRDLIPGYAYPALPAATNVPAAFQADWARFNVAGYPQTYLYTPSNNEYWQNASVISPAERYSLVFNGGYQITPNVELYGEFLYNHRESSQVGSGQVFQSFAQRNIVNGAPNNLPASNPNNPFGQPIQTFGIYESSSFQEIDYYRGVIGLRGDIGNWAWDVYGQYSLSDGSYNNGPRIYLDRFLALNSPNVACTNTPLGGNVSNFNCADLPGGIPWTSDRIGRGQYTDAERNFLFFTEDNTTTYKHGYVEAVISNNSLFALPAGDVGAAFGVHYRKEEIDDSPGPQALLRNVALFTTSGRTAGSDTVKEVFAEFEAPLLANLPLVDNLTLNVSGRYSDYDSYGDTTTYKAALNWQITPEYRLRANYGTSFRAPSLFEQFLGAQVGYQGQTIDPCYDYVDTPPDDSQILAGCIADNASTTLGGSSVAVSSTGGRGVVEAETGKTFNAGFVWTPSFTNLNVAVDYYDIQIENAVSQFGANEIITRCYQGRTDFCALYTRVRTPGSPDAGKLATVNNAYVNVNEIGNRGIDLQISWTKDTPLGRLRFDTQHNFKLEDSETLEGDTTDLVGLTYANGNGPAYAGNFYASLTRGDWTGFYGVDMIGKGSDLSLYATGSLASNTKYSQVAASGLPVTNASCTNIVAPTSCVVNKSYADFYVTHSASLRYRNENGWSATLGVQNLWDEAPPTAGSRYSFRNGSAALNAYDMRGRRITVRIGKTF